MGIKELYLVNPSLTFLGINIRRDATKYSFVGIPLDITSTFISGSRFAPYYVRLVSRSLETYSLRAGVDVEDIGIYDEGDVAVGFGDIESSFRAIEAVAEELIREGRFPIFVGGEHLITYPLVRAIVRGLASNVCVIVLDAHADFRNEYLGSRLSHACVTRRVSEVVSPSNVFLVGVRALCSEEVKELRRAKIKHITSLEILRHGVKYTRRRIQDFISTCKYVYVSLDMDVLDPAYAPGVSTPEPEGLTPTDVLDILEVVVPEAISLDIVEVVPQVDAGYSTAALAAKTVIETVALKEQAKGSRHT